MSGRRIPSAAQLQAQCDRFNAANPVGTPVRYWTGPRECEGRQGVTTCAAYVLSGHTAVVFIEGCLGCVSLSHVERDAQAVPA